MNDSKSAEASRMGIGARIRDFLARLVAEYQSGNAAPEYREDHAYLEGYEAFKAADNRNPYPIGSRSRRLWWIGRAVAKADWARVW
ncbi:hypothetical protein [Burkholderia vietnamiensis]|uniref:hypothetical protein n=1 Tax=Burkholderia vietnamiensis TaxID=60552 RepID=UPI00158E0BB9|nr:hypothetical protein [Burkholderia vietnamiensis]MCA8145488.1 hypothetical protein [Burkholderia vietnamiensis]